MDIDIERLETDAAYWDEVAPEGALYFNTEANTFFNYTGFWTSKSKQFIETINPRLRMDRSGPAFIPRPAKPAAPEWDEAGQFPAIGERVDACVYGDWQELVVCGYGNRFCIGINEDGEDIVFEFNDSTFRPIRTAEQRQRKELVDLMESERENYFPKAVTAEEIADAILSRYNLEPKDA